MNVELLTEARVRALVPEKIFRRGDAYCEQGAVLELARRNEVLRAAVAGSMDEPYEVQVTIRGDRILARCDCPYAEEWGGWCKHIVAVMLAVARRRIPIQEQPTVRALLAGLGRGEVERLVEALVEQAPRLYDLVRDRAERRREHPPRARQISREVPVDRAP